MEITKVVKPVIRGGANTFVQCMHKSLVFGDEFLNE